MGCVSRIIHDGGGGHAAPLPRRSHAGTTQHRAVPPPRRTALWTRRRWTISIWCALTSCENCHQAWFWQTGTNSLTATIMIVLMQIGFLFFYLYFLIFLSCSGLQFLTRCFLEGQVKLLNPRSIGWTFIWRTMLSSKQSCTNIPLYLLV